MGKPIRATKNNYKMATPASDNNVEDIGKRFGVHNRYFAVRHGQVVTINNNILLLKHTWFQKTERIKRTESNCFKSSHWFTLLWTNGAWKGTSAKGINVRSDTCK